MVVRPDILIVRHKTARASARKLAASGSRNDWLAEKGEREMSLWGNTTAFRSAMPAPQTVIEIKKGALTRAGARLRRADGDPSQPSALGLHIP